MSNILLPLMICLTIGAIVLAVVMLALAVAAFLRERRARRSLERTRGDVLEHAYRLQQQLEAAEEERARVRIRAWLQSPTFFRDGV